MKLVTAHYSLKTGQRTTDGYAHRNPELVKSFTLDPKFLRGKPFKIAKDGMPVNLKVAEVVAVLWNDHQKKLKKRRDAKVNELPSADPKNRPLVTATYSKLTGNRVSDGYAKSHPDRVESFTFLPSFLTTAGIAQDADGAAANLSAARVGEELRLRALKVNDAKNAARPAKAAATRGAKALLQPNVTASSVRKAIKGRWRK